MLENLSKIWVRSVIDLVIYQFVGIIKSVTIKTCDLLPPEIKLGKHFGVSTTQIYKLLHKLRNIERVSFPTDNVIINNGIDLDFDGVFFDVIKEKLDIFYLVDTIKHIEINNKRFAFINPSDMVIINTNDLRICLN